MSDLTDTHEGVGPDVPNEPVLEPNEDDPTTGHEPTEETDDA